MPALHCTTAFIYDITIAFGRAHFNIYLALAQYPILSASIRARMRRESFKRGVITPQAFEAEVREQSRTLASNRRRAQSLH